MYLRRAASKTLALTMTLRAPPGPAPLRKDGSSRTAGAVQRRFSVRCVPVCGTMGLARSVDTSLRWMSANKFLGPPGSNTIYYLVVGVTVSAGGYYTYKALTPDHVKHVEPGTDWTGDASEEPQLFQGPTRSEAPAEEAPATPPEVIAREAPAGAGGMKGAETPLGSEVKLVKPEVELTVQSVIEPVIEPVVESMVEPKFESMVELEVESAEKPVVETPAETSVEQMMEMESVVESKVEPVVEVESMMESVKESMVEPEEVEFMMESVEKSMVEPEVESLVQMMVAESMVESAATFAPADETPPEEGNPPAVSPEHSARAAAAEAGDGMQDAEWEAPGSELETTVKVEPQPKDPEI
ncbi:protein MGARP [Suncus etruscus]|uniref:protein MGARP n=1 Tax=Suncus etruscus TaxID=109475 RepID=UPI00210F2D88|nr:protein MGARP [Suncus etruscus]